MERKNSRLSSLAKGIDTALNRFLAIILAIMTIIIFAQVASRYLLNYSFSWSEEAARYLFLWSIFAGLPTLIYRGGMTSFDLLEKRLSGKTKIFGASIISVGYLVFFVLLVWGSIPLVQRQMGQMATSIPIPIGLVYAMMPVSGLLSMIVVVERFIATIAQARKES